MSYILDAIKKAERERDQIQMIDIEHSSVRSPSRLVPDLPIWLLISALLTMNLILFTWLLSPKAPLIPPTVYFISPLPTLPSGQPLMPNNQVSMESITESASPTTLSLSNSEKLLSSSQVPIDF
jgi:hypothetical protein